jgi:hypothetical protein
MGGQGTRAVPGVWAVERGAPPKWLWHLPRVSGAEEGAEQELDI